MNVYIEHFNGGKLKITIGPLLPRLRLLDYYFEDFFAAGKLNKARSWFKNMEVRV